MKIAMVLCGLAVVPLLAACGGGESRPAVTTPAATASTTVNPADFSPVVDNPLFPLTSTDMRVYEGEETASDNGDTVATRVESTVQPGTETIAGVEVTVVKEDDYEDGELVESTLDYYAQHKDGTVYYFGERVDEYEGGKIVGHHSQWLTGEGGAQPGQFMPADPQVGVEFAQEIAPGVAEDQSKVVAVIETVTVPAGAFTGCLKTEDYDPLDDVTEFKYYCPDVGLVREQLENGDLRLVSY